MKKFLIGLALLALLALVMYYGVLYGLISIVLFLSDVIVQLHSLIW